jgi:hypothetical protein
VSVEEKKTYVGFNDFAKLATRGFDDSSEVFQDLLCLLFDSPGDDLVGDGVKGDVARDVDKAVELDCLAVRAERLRCI